MSFAHDGEGRESLGEDETGPGRVDRMEHFLDKKFGSGQRCVGDGHGDWRLEHSFVDDGLDDRVVAVLVGLGQELVDFGESVIVGDPSPAVQGCLLYTSPSPRDKRQSRMPSSA